MLLMIDEDGEKIEKSLYMQSLSPTLLSRSHSPSL